MKTGAELIADERQRQIEVEGWKPGNDDQYNYGQLARAAVVYAETHLIRDTFKEGEANAMILDLLSDHWPFDEEWFKESTPIRNLVKAGALIAAEIDRLQRITKP